MWVKIGKGRRWHKLNSSTAARLDLLDGGYALCAKGGMFSAKEKEPKREERCKTCEAIGAGDGNKAEG